MSTMTKVRPRVKPERSIRLISPPRGDEPGVVRITTDRGARDYFLATFTTDFGKGFEMTKADEVGVVYHVNLDGDERHCDCPGHLRWGRCKHADGLAALVAGGRL